MYSGKKEENIKIFEDTIRMINSSGRRCHKGKLCTEFGGYFDEICFAVYCPPDDQRNFNAFKATLGGIRVWRRKRRTSQIKAEMYGVFLLYVNMRRSF